MRIAGTCVWLAVLICSAIYLAGQWQSGFRLSTDLLALLPERQNTHFNSVVGQAVTKSLTREVVFVFGHANRAVVRRAATEFTRDLENAGLAVDVNAGMNTAGREKLGKLFFKHRAGLLAEADRQRLLKGRASEIYHRALAQIFSPIGIIDSRLLRADPFQLFPEYLGALWSRRDRPSMGSDLTEFQIGDMAHAVVSAKFGDEPYDLSFQTRFIEWFEDWNAAKGTGHDQGLEVLKAGAVFYAHAGAKQGLEEGGVIGGITLVGLIALVLLAFGNLQPLWLSLLSIVSGLTVALAANFLLFDNLHYIAVIFGASLIGVSVDYSFHYCCERFGNASLSIKRLRHILPGATIGLITSIIGFLTLAWAPFPGLRQVSMISAVGLAMAYFTVIIWFPILDRSSNRPAKRWLIEASTYPRNLWRDDNFRRHRGIILVALIAAVAVGATMFSFSDDVRKFQALSPELRTEESAIRDIIGHSAALQFIVVTGSTDEELLQREELLRDRLNPLQIANHLASIVAISKFVPSAARQAENQALVRRKLDASFRRQLETQIGLSFEIDRTSSDTGPLTLDAFRAVAPGVLTDRLILDLGQEVKAHIVLLLGVTKSKAIKAVTERIEGVEFVDPVSDISALFGEYRQMAMLLLGISILLIAPVLLVRYRGRGSLWVLVPPVAAISITPFLVALAGEPFTFFNVMALILIFAVGIDYALFCREAKLERREVTGLANGLAATTTILSFGLLAFSGVPAVHSFGLTVFLGIVLAFFLAPLAEQNLDEGAKFNDRN